jgi:hypothetical protein
MSKSTAKNPAPDARTPRRPPAQAAAARALLADWARLGAEVERGWARADELRAGADATAEADATDDAADAANVRRVDVEHRIAELCLAALGRTAADLGAGRSEIDGEFAAALVLDGHVLIITPYPGLVDGYCTEIVRPENVVMLG